MQKELFSLFGNGHRENIIFTINAGVSVTLHFKDDGTDTASDKYFNLGSQAKKVHIMVDNAASMTHIENNALKSPRTLSVGGNSYSIGIEWNTIIVRADSDSTTFEVYAS